LPLSSGQSNKNSPKSAEGADFEQAIVQLEEIIEKIESGQIGLEKSISEYERGVGLIRRCRQVLDRAEQRVEELTAQMQAEKTSPGKDLPLMPDDAPKDGTPF
jgi:exodeoxyribonuclease VII small subunit